MTAARAGRSVLAMTARRLTVIVLATLATAALPAAISLCDYDGSAVYAMANGRIDVDGGPPEDW